MNRPIFITGAGIICPIGTNVNETSKSLENKDSGISAIKYLKTDHKEFPVGEVKLSNREMKDILGISESVPTTRTSLMGIMALQEAIKAMFFSYMHLLIEKISI